MATPPPSRRPGPVALRNWLANENTSAAALARLVGVSRPAIAAIANGLRQPSLRLAVALQRIAHIDPAAWVPAADVLPGAGARPRAKGPGIQSGATLAGVLRANPSLAAINGDLVRPWELGGAGVDVDIALRLTPNSRHVPIERARIVRKQRAAVAQALAGYAPPTERPLVVNIERVRPERARPLDDDNLVASAKAVRDEVARWLRVDDADRSVAWVVSDATGDAANCWKLNIRVSAHPFPWQANALGKRDGASAAAQAEAAGRSE